MSGVTLTQTHNHRDLVNAMVRDYVLEMMLTESLWVWSGLV